jgi:hypothetical protein
MTITAEMRYDMPTRVTHLLYPSQPVYKPSKRNGEETTERMRKDQREKRKKGGWVYFAILQPKVVYLKKKGLQFLPNDLAQINKTGETTKDPQKKGQDVQITHSSHRAHRPGPTNTAQPNKQWPNMS